MKTLKDLINQYSKEMKLHISKFGSGKNRNIDTREKSTMIMIPIVIQKRIRAEAKKWIKEDFEIDNFILTFRTQKWMKRLNLTEEDLQ